VNPLKIVSPPELLPLAQRERERLGITDSNRLMAELSLDLGGIQVASRQDSVL